MILLSNSKLYVVSKLIDTPVACLDIDQIFSVQFIADDPDEASGANKETGEDASVCLSIVYYDKVKFEREISKSRDPFDVASKFLKIRFAKVNQKVKDEFEARIKEEQENNFATFF